jgi:hypothetical protein
LATRCLAWRARRRGRELPLVAYYANEDRTALAQLEKEIQGYNADAE